MTPGFHEARGCTEVPKKATKQPTLFAFNYTMTVPIGKSGKRMCITGESAIEAREDLATSKATKSTLGSLGSYKCASCGFVSLSARGLDLHHNLSSSCSGLVALKKAEAKARLVGDLDEQSATKKARLAASTLKGCSRRSSRR